MPRHPRSRIDLDEAGAILAEGVARGVFPGAQLAVSWGDERFATRVAGTLCYDRGSPRVDDATRYDLASLTKPVTALAVVRLAARGRLSLGSTVREWIPGAKGSWVGGCTLEALFSHRAGLPDWMGLFAEIPTADLGTPRAMGVALERISAAPQQGSPGIVRYSDLGYIVAGEALARAEGISLSQVLRAEVLAPVGIDASVMFRGTGEQWIDPAIAKTEDCPWRGRTLQGEVHDENAWALGGTAGHAGLFGTASDLAALGRCFLDALLERDEGWIDGPSARAMVEPRDGGTHRFGWDGKSAEGSSSGARMDPTSFGHLGFTGTSLWCDPVADVAVALVSNRVHPTRENTAIRALRPLLHDAVMRALR